MKIEGYVTLNRDKEAQSGNVYRQFAVEGLFIMVPEVMKEVVSGLPQGAEVKIRINHESKKDDEGRWRNTYYLQQLRLVEDTF